MPLKFSILSESPTDCNFERSPRVLSVVLFAASLANLPAVRTLPIFRLSSTTVSAERSIVSNRCPSVGISTPPAADSSGSEIPVSAAK